MSMYEGEATLLTDNGTVYLTHVKLNTRGNSWYGVATSVVMPKHSEVTIEFPNGVRADALVIAHNTRDAIAIAVNGQGEIPSWG